MSTVVKSCIYNVWLHVFLFNTNKGVANPLTNHSANEHPPRIIGLSKKKYHGFCMALFSIPQAVHLRRLFLLHRKWDMLCRDGIRKRLLASCSWNLLPPLKFDIDIQNGNSDIFYKPDFGYPCEISGGTKFPFQRDQFHMGIGTLGFRVGPQWFQPVEFLGPFPRCQSHLPGLELGGGFSRSTTNRTTVPVRNLPPKILTQSSSQKIGENGIS